MKLFRTYTWQSLRANRTRTWVTIIGIVLSVALLTAVAAGAYSGQQYMIDTQIALEGAYHCYFTHVSAAELQEIQNDDQISSAATLDTVGYAPYDSGVTGSRPYLYLTAASENIEDLLALNISQGRLPRTEREILLPDYLLNYGIKLPALGQTLTLEVGERTLEGEALDQNNPYVEGETFAARQTVTYTVVGYYERMSWNLDPVSAAGYTALTGGIGVGDYTVLCTLDDPRQTYDLLEERAWGQDSGINYSMLQYYGTSSNDHFIRTLYSLMGILMGLIMFGSVSLIYDSFAISVVERTKQFGLLRSMGATRRQIRYTVLYEALLLCLVGIPVGLLVGCGGIGVTLYLLRDHFALLMGAEETAVTIGLRLRPWVLLLSATVGLLTALISAWIPACRAMGTAPMEALRQTADIRIRPRQVRTSRLTGKLFGYAGVLAAKNFKRNRRKYRATVLSLFMSLVLFISAAAFTMYLTALADGTSEDYGYDIRFVGYEEDADPEDFLARSLALEGMESGTYCNGAQIYLQVPVELLSETYLEWYPCHDEVEYANVLLSFIRDEEYQALAEEAGVRYDPDAPMALIYDHVKSRITDSSGSYVVEYATLDHENLPQTLNYGRIRQIEGYVWMGYSNDQNGDTVCEYLPEGIAYGWQEQTDDQDDYLTLPVDEAQELVPLLLGPVMEGSAPLYMAGGLTLVYPYSAQELILGSESKDLGRFYCLYTATDHELAYDQLQSSLAAWGMDTDAVYDYAYTLDANRAVVTVIQVFAYGFIVLISLIAAANVFNTISTNIGLRRRELAMLQSVGLSRRGLHRMMNYECLLYGLKALLYGLPVSVGVCRLIYKAVGSSYVMDFTLPWGSILVAVLSVFLVVFATMLYAMHKIKGDNLIDVLRCETL